MSDINLDPDAKVLVVDDMDSVRFILIGILIDMGFKNILEAANGEDAMTCFLEQTESLRNIDLIISDLNMPIMSGFEFLKAVRSHYFGGEVPFLVVTTEQDKGVVVECIEAGASNYIIKPFDKEVVKERIFEAYKTHKL